MRELPSYLITLAAGVILGWLLKPVPESSVRSVVEVHTDTVTQVVTKPVVRWAKVADTVVYHDTSFIATVDTVLMGDTTTITYEYPSNLFTLLTRPAPDTAQTIYVTRTITTERPWWIDVLTHTGAATLGYAVGSIR